VSEELEANNYTKCEAGGTA